MNPIHVLMTTEGTYPFVVGGVSTWCQQLLTGLSDVEWSVLPVTAGGHDRAALFTLPPNARLLPEIELWWPWRRRARRTRVHVDTARPSLPIELARNLIGWETDQSALVDALAWCRQYPWAIESSFRSADGFSTFVAAVDRIAREAHPDTLPVALSAGDAARLYQTLAWVARTASEPTPWSDVVLVTAAGWAAIPALVDKAMRGTPMLLTEHGVYVREVYLASIRDDPPVGDRFTATRLARGLARAAYAAADVVCPVTEAHAPWELALGADARRIRTICNGADVGERPSSPSPTRTVVTVGRLDPLKDVQTMLRVAAAVVDQEPTTRFLHYGPVPDGQEAYAKACYELHEQLGLGEAFRFCGRTSDPTGVLQEAEIVMLTSISEGFPMAVLEAMAQARPVVATAVGGVPEALHGCGVLAPPGDVHRLAQGIVTLLRDPTLARRLAERARQRVESRYRLDSCLDSYRDVIGRLASGVDLACT